MGTQIDANGVLRQTAGQVGEGGRFAAVRAPEPSTSHREPRIGDTGLTLDELIAEGLSAQNRETESGDYANVDYTVVVALAQMVVELRARQL